MITIRGVPHAVFEVGGKLIGPLAHLIEFERNVGRSSDAPFPHRGQDLGNWAYGQTCRGGGMADAADLKSSIHPVTQFYQMVLRSIYRRFSRQSKLTSCLVSQGESLIFPSSLIFFKGLSRYLAERIYCARNSTREGKDKMWRPPGCVKVRIFKPRNGPVIGEMPIQFKGIPSAFIIGAIPYCFGHAAKPIKAIPIAASNFLFSIILNRVAL
jgi:hypothetical protein